MADETPPAQPAPVVHEVRTVVRALPAIISFMAAVMVALLFMVGATFFLYVGQANQTTKQNQEISATQCWDHVLDQAVQPSGVRPSQPTLEAEGQICAMLDAKIGK